MKVVCEVDIGNDAEHPDTKIIVEGDPFYKSGFVTLSIGSYSYEVRPHELIRAIELTRSDMV